MQCQVEIPNFGCLVQIRKTWKQLQYTFQICSNRCRCLSHSKPLINCQLLSMFGVKKIIPQKKYPSFFIQDWYEVVPQILLFFHKIRLHCYKATMKQNLNKRAISFRISLEILLHIQLHLLYKTFITPKILIYNAKKTLDTLFQKHTEKIIPTYTKNKFISIYSMFSPIIIINFHLYNLSESISSTPQTIKEIHIYFQNKTFSE